MFGQIDLECSCFKGTDVSCDGGGQLIADMTIDANMETEIVAETAVDATVVRLRDVEASIEFLSEISSEIRASLPFDTELSAEAEIQDDITVEYSIGELLSFEGNISVPDTDKIHGTFENFGCQEKLYPYKDLPVDSGFGLFVGPYGEEDDLYSYIDEGVYEDLMIDRGNPLTLSDDKESFIHPDTIHTEGLFQYRCEVTNLNIRPDYSNIRIRASAPMQNYESKIAPLYTLYNIRLSDPSGNLLIKYNDLQFRGDSEYTTYSIAPETNVLQEYDWERRNSPLMNGGSGYYVSFNVRAVALDDAFTEGFSDAFEENYVIVDTFSASGNDYLALDGSPLSTQEVNFLNPSPGFKVSSIELCNSGGFGPRKEDYFPFYLEVPEIGRRLERSITPNFMPIYDFDTTIYPSVDTVWEDQVGTLAGSPLGVTNQDKCGAEELVKIIREPNSKRYIKLQSSTGGGVSDSGKLILRFGDCTSNVDEITNGAFNFEFDQGTKSIWWTPSGAFNVENRVRDKHLNDNTFYSVDSITLKVLAKKETGTRDYVLDVVGYSDDTLLHRTSPSGGFLQNPESVQLNDLTVSSVGSHPVLSGFYQRSDDWTLGGAGLSEHENYFESSGNPGGDHYLLTQYPTVTGTDFQWYEVPLQIFEDEVLLGRSTDYAIKSYLEKIYLDIFPLPSGASIASVQLCVRYAPSNAINFYTQGGESFGKTQDGRSEAALFPTSMQSGDNILNAGSGYGPISLIEGVPHLYSSPSTLKTNYARRWRGVEGTVRGPYDPDAFAFGFENPVIDYPFLSGYYKLDNINGRYVQSVDMGPTAPSGLGTLSGLFTQDPEVYHNVGWRFTQDSIFASQLPGFSGNYTTSDWTSLSNGSTDFSGDPLYGKIADAFDRVVRISQDTQNINFGNIDTASGFSIFTRFTPDVNISGASYNLFNSGVLFAKWDTANDLDFALGYKNGYLCGYSKDSSGNLIEVLDTVEYSGYQFPLNVILTYNDNGSNKLKLYTDNELHEGDFDTLRASSSPFVKNVTDADFIVGWSRGSGVGMNMLLSEMGISTYGNDELYGSGTNIVESNPDKTYKQVTAETFLENSRAKFFNPNESHTNDRFKLWDRVNEDTYNDWQIGDFKYCEFNFAFDQLQNRPNKEQIVFDINHNGSGYSAYSDLSLPTLIDSGVAYHTQIENDFLRFHLSDVPNNFYAANRRITKNIPCGYKFSEKSIVVESVVEHNSSGDIRWHDCDSKIGPRLIVSLYTKKQEPYWTTAEPNWGLVNRKVHYLSPSSCMMRLDTTFNYDDLNDESEEWAIFPQEPRIKEFSEKYFSEDINDMFVQYDLAYPSGQEFKSKINLHSSHVRLADANIYSIVDADSLNLYSSGAFPSDSQLSLNIGGFPTENSGLLRLNINVPLPYDVFEESPDGFTLSVSGALNVTDNLNLYMPPQSGVELFTLNISGAFPDSVSNSVNLAMPKTFGKLDTSDDGSPITSIAGIGDFFGVPLSVFNATVAESPTGPVLSLNTFASSGNDALYSSLPMVAWNNIKNTLEGDASGSISLNVKSDNIGEQRRYFGVMPMYINSPNILDENVNLYIHNPEADYIVPASSDMGLALNSNIVLWSVDNYGSDIDIADNYAASLPADNEIRGVDLTAYGDCDGDSPSKAIDRPLVTDCTVWREAVCNDAGIFRAKDTYTNSGAINFEGGLGYSGNYYGIRKFTDLLPSVSYETILKVKTGSTDPIQVPPTFEEWGYGMCGPDWYEGGCCTEDCDQNLVFSGVKLVADAAQLAITPELLLESGRSELDNYGKSVSVKGDLMAVASPNMTIPDYDQTTSSQIDVSGAGAVFLYRRSEDIPGKRADWQYMEALSLPIGYRKDYIQRTADNLLTFDQFSISGNKWQIGQEGRQFGSSLDMCSSGDREVVVVGAPRAKWSREFEDLNTSGIPSAGMIFADIFEYNKSDLSSVAAAASKFNILWKYFSAPWNPGPNEWYAEINPKIIVLQLTYSNKDYPVVPTDESDWFTHKYIPRLDDLDLLEEVGTNLLGEGANLSDKIEAAKPVVFNTMYSGVLDAFFQAFPKEQEAVYSGIPAIVGMFKEQTGSTAGALRYADADGEVYNLYDAFSDFYSEYSIKSGVYDQTTGLAQNGHLNTVVGQSENWATSTRELLSNTFDSGRLSTTYTNSTLNRDFIASGVGQEWGDTHGSIVEEFQVPPASGGRVYIFEKERDNFNCIQVIVSPNDEAELSSSNEDIFGPTYSKSYNDRFGHAVSISKNGEVVSVGSPWNDTPCRIFERNEEQNQLVYSRVRDWCSTNGKNEAVSYYDNILIQSGVATANVATYDFLSASERFAYRNDINFWDTLPQPYSLSYTYSYGDIQYVGTRKFLPNTFAPTSRLGWSTSVNDGGDVVAFGAPTDSFNQFEDANVWGDNNKLWASFLHAGAVRVFESRKSYPHSGVIEFGRFGNLDRASHKEERDAGFYDQMDVIFGSGADGTTSYQGKYWRRTDFSEIEIPRDAGLAFIITPEIDAASDEIIDNIKNWLALGDRNLVLVGNDPVWEENGLYQESNDVINKILEKLGSRMTLVPAKNREYSIQGCVSQENLLDDKYNITAAKVPQYSAGVTIGTGNYYAKGVADIRINLEADGLTNYEEYMACPEGATCGDDDPPVVNTRCEFPLKHLGDLRAEWTEQCVKRTPESCKIVTYKKNWPLNFSNTEVDCDDPPQPLFLKPFQEPVPVLTTAEHLPPSAWYQPASSGFFCDYRTIYEWRVSQRGDTSHRFAENQLDRIDFNIEEDENSDVAGIFNSFSYGGDFFDPEVVNGRDSLLQAVGWSYYPEDEERIEERTIYPESILAIVESGKKDNGDLNNSRIYMLASQWSEDDASRGIDAATSNDDKNTEFYINMVRKDCVEAPRGLQVNGFTGRSSLSNAYYLKDDSETTGHNLGKKLKVEFVQGGGDFIENAELSDLNELINFVWIANPSGKPSASDVQELKSWLDLGGKKLIITYNAAAASSRQEIADNVAHLCEQLNISSRPILMPNVGEYFVTDPIIQSYTDSDDTQLVNEDADSIVGCPDGYGFTFPNYDSSTSVKGLEFSSESRNDPYDPSDNQGFDKRRFIPISGGIDYEKIIWFDNDVVEPYTVIPTNRWKIDGESTIEFPVEVGSGYRIFVNWVSEKTSEKFNICGDIDGATTDLGGGEGGVFSGADNACGTVLDLSKTTVYQPSQAVIDVKATGDKITISLDTSRWSEFIPEEDLIDGVIPSTPRLLSISGCPLPIIEETVITTTSGLFPIGTEPYNCQWLVNPARSGEVPGVSRPVSHRSSLYCTSYPDAQCSDLGTELIEDGPVVVAEEFENFSAFQAGKRRSKIIVISDSTMVQGQCPHYRGSSIINNQAFIRSLYPQSPSEQYNGKALGSDFVSPLINEASYSGRNWFFSQKLRAPEVGSPAKYYAVSGHVVDGMISPLYGGAGVTGNLELYSDQEDYFDPTSMSRPSEIKDEEKIKERITQFYENDAIGTHNMFPRFSGDFLNITPAQDYNELLGIDGGIKPFIVDAGIGGGMHDLMKINNTDYLDLDIYYSGCLGDLFGYSVDISDNKMVVGTPFNAFYTEGAISGVSGIVQWHEIQNDSSRSGLRIAEDGGAGAAFIFERTGSGQNVVSEFLPWEFAQKIKPSSLNVGMTDFSPTPKESLEIQRGEHQLDNPSYILEFAKRSDNFGVSVSIDCDMVAVGAPNHDFETLHDHIYSGVVTSSGLSTAFQRKSFNAEYDIPEHVYYDLGSSGVRIDQFNGASGTMVLNNGAVFTYRNEMIDFQSRNQSWIYAEKLYAQGYKDRTQTVYGDDGLGNVVLIASGTENDRFGSSVSINRAKRGDADYSLIVGSPNHNWSTSGNHPTSGLLRAGSAYSFDSMLREQVPSIPNGGGWIDAYLFGNKNIEGQRIGSRVYQNASGEPITYETSGIISTNSNGDVFLEVSGFDPSAKGFIAHRPYVDSVTFKLFPGTGLDQNLGLMISGSPVDVSGNVNLSLIGPDQANVYNNMSLYQFGVDGSSSGIVNMFIEAPSGQQADSLNLNITSTETTDSLDLRIRGY